ncbi:hypothetical protein DFA_07490 [Cavenderia fasciculata]|uniref:J domain-containing protein n=1 Tax=Cavenderia fasciculata TaxID=261658 RepID=F4PWK2_CACFS|nr:uncharacterized protein DFA_07490 [Cavenderia fasciculata]EGG20366.1 hypothetical protein DFA_07490 [Cavenderia fasciculata]|eukprot:XP_004367349.1 hypothetical protein DFA_07490 [Cavenderia fasciculata]
MNIDRQFKSVFIVNTYLHSVIIKHIKQINRLLSAPYDRKSYYYEPIGYYNWYQLTEYPIQLARHGYFDQLQSTLLVLEQKYANFKWFGDDDDDSGGYQQADNYNHKRKWIPNLKEIIRSSMRYPFILKNLGHIINKPYQDDHSCVINKRNKFIQEFMYTRYGVDNLEEFIETVTTFSLKAGDMSQIKWIESIHNNDSILNVMKKYTISDTCFFQSSNQEFVYSCLTRYPELLGNFELTMYLRDRENTTMINNLFDNDMHRIENSLPRTILHSSMKRNHPRAIEIIHYFGKNESLKRVLLGPNALDNACLSPGGLPILLNMVEYFPGHLRTLTQSGMDRAIIRGHVDLVRYILDNTKLTINMDMAATEGQIKILKLGYSNPNEQQQQQITQQSLISAVNGHLDTFKWVIDKYPSMLFNIDDPYFKRAISSENSNAEMFKLIPHEIINFDLVMEIAIEQERLDFVQVIVQLANQIGYTFKQPSFLPIVCQKPKSVFFTSNSKIEIFKYLYEQGHVKYFGDNNYEQHLTALYNCLEYGWHEPARLLIGILQKMCGEYARDRYLPRKESIDKALRSYNIDTIKLILEYYSVDEFPRVKENDFFNYSIEESKDPELVQFLYHTFKDQDTLTVSQFVSIHSHRTFKFLLANHLINANMYKNKFHYNTIGIPPYNNIDTIIKEADELFKTARYDASVEKYTMAIDMIGDASSESSDMSSKLTSVLFKRAGIYQTKGKNILALSDLNRALQYNPTNVHAKLKRAKILTSLGRFEDATDEYKSVLKTKPDNPEAKKQLALIQKTSSQLEQAKELYEGNKLNDLLPVLNSILESTPDNKQSRLWRCECSFNIKDYRRVIDDTTAVLKADGSNLEAMYWRAKAFFALGEKDAALKFIKDGLKFDSDHSKLKQELTRITKFDRNTKEANDFFVQGRYEESLRETNSALELEPNHPQYSPSLYLLKCKVLLKLRKGQDAINACGKSIELDDNSADAYYNRGEAFMYTEEYDRALADFQKAHEKSPNDHNIMDGIRRAQQKQKQAKRKDYYKLLGVDKGATPQEIKKAFKKLALTHHPDKGDQSEESKKKYVEMTEAYETLIDQDKRDRYDRGEDVNDPMAGRQQQQGFGGGFPFGGGFGFGGGGGGGHHHQQQQHFTFNFGGFGH